MTNIKPKVYPAEFKESAVKLAIESKRPVAQTAKELVLLEILYILGWINIANLKNQ